MRPWTQDEAALVIGLRAMGEDPIDIADRMRTTRAEILILLKRIRPLLVSGSWIGELLVPVPAARADAPDRRTTRPEVLRPYAVRSDIDELAELAAARDITALLMGDPEPGRRTLGTSGPLAKRISLPTVKGFSNGI